LAEGFPTLLLFGHAYGQCVHLRGERRDHRVPTLGMDFGADTVARSRVANITREKMHEAFGVMLGVRSFADHRRAHCCGAGLEGDEQRDIRCRGNGF